MNLEHAIFYVTHHSETIIQWLFLIILLLALAIIGNMLFGKKGSEGATAGAGGPSLGSGAGAIASSPEIQGFLEKILAQTAKLEAVTVDKMNPAMAAETDAKIQALKKDLASREDELAKAKAGGYAKSSEVADKLAVRIKELESKLAEYEILEDDIADLSLYKEENARLRSELDKAKGTTPAAAAQAIALRDQPSGVPPGASGEDIVAEFAEAVSQKTMPLDSATVEVTASGNPMADFESAVNLEKKMLSEEVRPPLAAAPKTKSATAAAAAAPATGEGDDLFAEFANPPPAEPEPPAADGAAPEGGLDTDKMMAEMAALVSVEPSAGSALDDNIDTEKMALEATNLHKT